MKPSKRSVDAVTRRYPRPVGLCPHEAIWVDETNPTPLEGWCASCKAKVKVPNSAYERHVGK